MVGADGRKSLCRAAAGIETERRDYPQAALTLNLGHARPHNGISTEFHTETGPFTLVPLPGLRSSLVCVVDPDEAEQLGALDAPALSDRDRAARALDPRQDVGRGRRAGCFRSAVETAQSFAARSHRAGRRSRACHPADRRAGAQSRPARCRDHRASSSSKRGATAPMSARRAAGALRPDAPNRCDQPRGRGRRAQPQPACRTSSPCRARAASGSICSTASRRCAAP